MGEKAYLNWSSGKDSALALHRVQSEQNFEIVSLFTTCMGSAEGQVPMHEVGLALLRRQAACLGLPLTTFSFDPVEPAEAYGQAMQRATDDYCKQGICTAVFGDICLEPVRKRREEKLAGVGIRAHFPLWGSDPEKLMHEFIALGFRAIVTCVDGAVLDERFVGRVIDRQFLKELPPNADLCGENGEYHSFVFDGPIFLRPVPFQVKGTYSREYPGEREPHRYWYLRVK